MNRGRFWRGGGRKAAAFAWGVALLAVLVSSFAPLSADQLPRALRPLVDLGHLPAYGLLAALTLQLVLSDRRMSYWRGVVVSAAATIIASGVIEWLQPYVGRSRDLADFGVSTSGVLLALALITVTRYRAARHATPGSETPGP